MEGGSGESLSEFFGAEQEDHRVGLARLRAQLVLPQPLQPPTLTTLNPYSSQPLHNPQPLKPAVNIFNSNPTILTLKPALYNH